MTISSRIRGICPPPRDNVEDAGGAVVSPRRLPVALCLLEEAVEVRCAADYDPLAGKAVQLDRLLGLDLVPNEETVRMLVEGGLAGEVVPAPDEHDRR